MVQKQNFKPILIRYKKVGLKWVRWGAFFRTRVRNKAHDILFF